MADKNDKRDPPTITLDAFGGVSVPDSSVHYSNPTPPLYEPESRIRMSKEMGEEHPA